MSTVTSGQTQYKRAVEGGKNSTNTWGNLQNNFFPAKPHYCDTFFVSIPKNL